MTMTISILNIVPQALAACMAISSPQSNMLVEPEPVMIILDSELPQYLNDSELEQLIRPVQKLASKAMYDELRQQFNLSHTKLAELLGLKHRSLYNWFKVPQSIRNYEQVEKRLLSLNALKDEMEPEHRPFIYKIAFSPIDGNPRFGETLLSGADQKSLIHWYDMLYDKFDLMA